MSWDGIVRAQTEKKKLKLDFKKTFDTIHWEGERIPK
jgi:hypothetical protein